MYRFMRRQRPSQRRRIIIFYSHILRHERLFTCRRDEYFKTYRQCLGIFLVSPPSVHSSVQPRPVPAPPLYCPKDPSSPQGQMAQGPFGRALHLVRVLPRDKWSQGPFGRAHHLVRALPRDKWSQGLFGRALHSYPSSPQGTISTSFSSEFFLTRKWPQGQFGRPLRTHSPKCPLNVPHPSVMNSVIANLKAVVQLDCCVDARSRQQVLVGGSRCLLGKTARCSSVSGMKARHYITLR
jgi:hypothetical protein